jgi:membrane protease subunit HflK
VKLLRRAAIAVAVLAGVGLYVAAGLFEVAPDEEAVVLRLGRYARTESPGLRWRLLGLEKLEKRQVTVTQTEEFGFRTLSPGPPAEYEERPEEKRMLTGDENVVDVEFVLQYRIIDLPKFLFSVQEVPQIIRDVAESAAREVIAQRPIDAILTEARGPIEDEAAILIQTLLDSYGAGIEIQNVQLQDVEPPDPVKDAFADVVTAKQDRERMILEAQGYADQVVPQARGEAKKLVNQARGYRESQILEARGRADRFLALFQEYRKAPEVTRERLYLETLDEILPGVEKVIIEEGQADNVLPYLQLPRGGKSE